MPRGGPDGGDGGSGGNVWLVGDPQLRDLSAFLRAVHFKAGPGWHGRGGRKDGASGEDIEIRVPLGTQVWDAHTLLADIVRPGERILVARGGAGGRGNSHFVSATRQAPRFAEFGGEGEERWLNLTLQLVADVGIAGLPNAGKSSLLRRLSKAKPKVADYPFTTLEPVLGVVDAPGEDESFTLVDVPGLLEGATEGVGLGTEFLAHLERCHLLLHLVDVSGYYGRSPIANFRTILGELGANTPELGQKPQLVVLNKVDLVSDLVAAEELRTIREEVAALRDAGHPAFVWGFVDETPSVEEVVLPASVASGEGLSLLVQRVACYVREFHRNLVDETEATSPTTSAEARMEHHVIYRPAGRDEAPFSVRREGDTFIVEGEGVARLVRRFDLENDEAARFLATRLERLGVYDALRAAGAQPGDEVIIDGRVFEFD